MDKEWEKLEKISAWNLTKVRSKKEVIDEARTKGAKVHFASLMNICQMKNAELEAKHQKYKGRVVLRGDIVKDDSGSYAVFTEQGSSASQMTSAKVMDIISRLPGCDGQAADAVSAYTQVKMEDAHKGLKIPKSECPDWGDPGTRRTYHPRLQKAQGREVMEIKILGVQLLRKRKDRGDPMSAAIERLHSTSIIMNNLWKVSSASYSKWDDDHARSSQKWKTDTEMCERSGRPDETSWRATRETQPGFSHEETQHDGTARKIGETRCRFSRRNMA